MARPPSDDEYGQFDAHLSSYHPSPQRGGSVGGSQRVSPFNPRSQPRQPFEDGPEDNGHFQPTQQRTFSGNGGYGRPSQAPAGSQGLGAFRANTQQQPDRRDERSPQRQPRFDHQPDSREQSPMRDPRHGNQFAPPRTLPRQQPAYGGTLGNGGGDADFMPDVRRPPPREDTLMFLEEWQRNPQPQSRRTRQEDYEDDRQPRRSHQQRQQAQSRAPYSRPESVDRRQSFGRRNEDMYERSPFDRFNNNRGSPFYGNNQRTPVPQQFARIPGNQFAAQSHPFPTPPTKKEPAHDIYEVLYVAAMYRNTKLKRFQNGTFKHYRQGGKTVLLDEHDNTLETAFYPKGINEGMCLDLEKYYVEVDVKKKKPKKNAAADGSESPPKKAMLPKRTGFKPPSFVAPAFVEPDDDSDDESGGGRSEPPRAQGGFDVSRFEEPQRRKKKAADDRDRDDDSARPAKRRYREEEEDDRYERNQRGGGGGGRRSSYRDREDDRPRHGNRGGSYDREEEERPRYENRNAGYRNQQDDRGYDDRSPAAFRGAREVEVEERRSPARYDQPRGEYVLVRDESDERRSDGRGGHSGPQSRRFAPASSPPRRERYAADEWYERRDGDRRDDERDERRAAPKARDRFAADERGYDRDNDVNEEEEPRFARDRRSPELEADQYQRHPTTRRDDSVERRPNYDPGDESAGAAGGERYDSRSPPPRDRRYSEDERQASPEIDEPEAERRNEVDSLERRSSPAPAPERHDEDLSPSDEEEARIAARHAARARRPREKVEFHLMETEPLPEEESDSELVPPEEIIVGKKPGVVERLLEERKKAMGLDSDVSESLTPGKLSAVARSSSRRDLPSGHDSISDGIQSKENVSPRSISLRSPNTAGFSAPQSLSKRSQPGSGVEALARASSRPLVEESPERPTASVRPSTFRSKQMPDDIEE